MPTGYTARVTETTTLREFALSCARAFGALIELRDEPMDAPIPEAFEMSSYHRDALARDEARLKELESTTPEQADALCRAEYATALKHYEKAVADHAAERAKYDRLVSLVTKWKPPTSEHEGLKNFMLEQLRTTIDGDCYEPTPPKLTSGADWLEATLKSARWGVEYHRKGWKEDQERAAERTKWVAELRKSLP